jgi:hypothetical protein
MKKPLFFSIFLLLQMIAVAQSIQPGDEKILQEKEDSLKSHALKIIKGNSAVIRFESDSIFTKMFVRALKTPNSFYYPFDSLETISKIYAPDNSFRIFTWQMVVNENLVRQHGAIQMNTADGSLKLFPLVDKSDVTAKLTDTIGDNKGWIGAVYYKVIQTENNNQNYYTLLGYDENNIRSNRKVIEVLSFDNGVPTFGGRYFSFDQDTIKKPTTSRYIMEYKKDAGPRLTYDDDMQMIVFEHLESETNEPTKKWTMVPDGDYEAFKWEKGKWVHVEKIFNQITAEGKEPMPSPIKDAEGNTIEDNLKDNVDMEKKQATAKPAAKPAVPVKKAKPKKVKQ